MSTVIVPLDPDSPKGRETAARLTDIFARVRLAIAERRTTVQQAPQGGRAA